METAYNSDQWKFMEEMCILVDDHDNQIGSESKKTCSTFLAYLYCRSFTR